MPTFEVVPVRHIPTIKQLGYQTYRPHYPHLWKEGGIDWYLNKCFNEQQLALDLADPSLSYYTIRFEGQDVGLLKLVKNKSCLDLKAETSLYLEKIYFLKPFTGLGLGQKTMEWVFEQAQQGNFLNVWLMTMDSSLKAIASYEKAGFKIIGRTRLDDEEFFRLKSELRGMVVLQKDLCQNHS